MICQQFINNLSGGNKVILDYILYIIIKKMLLPSTLDIIFIKHKILYIDSTQKGYIDKMSEEENQQPSHQIQGQNNKQGKRNIQQSLQIQNGDNTQNNQQHSSRSRNSENNNSNNLPNQVDEFDKFESVQHSKQADNENIQDKCENKENYQNNIKGSNVERQVQKVQSQGLDHDQQSNPSQNQQQGNVCQQLKQSQQESKSNQGQIKVGSSQQNNPQQSQNSIPKISEPLQSQNSSKIYKTEINQQINNSIIIKQAQRERISITFSIFQKYNVSHQNIVESYKLIIKNIYQSIEMKKNYKRNLQSILKDYFETYVKSNNDFYDKTFKIKMVETTFQGNKFINIKEELKKGIQELILVRKSVANDIYKLSNYIDGYIIKKTESMFQKYYESISAEQKKQLQKSQDYWNQQKTFTKLIQSITKILKKQAEGKKQKEDIFLWIIKFVNEEKIYRQSLINYGRTVLELRNAYIYSENQLFKALQLIMNQFKTESRKFYSVKKKQFLFLEDYTSMIEEDAKFEKLCTITDVDYIIGVLEIHNRKEKTQKLSNQNFTQYLSLPFFDKMVGNIKILLNGTYNKTFPLYAKNEELVHTISGNLVHYNKENDECKQRFIVRCLNAKIVGDGVIQFDELIKGIIFQNSKIVRLRLKDSDRAQELICYLNEKEEDRKRQIQLIRTQ